uniref:Uncharacterized protein n=1 Tax=Ascaris lumbricoides TaxID=6252 RepID=A0A0M3IIG8_ASCLU
MIFGNLINCWSCAVVELPYGILKAAEKESLGEDASSLAVTCRDSISPLKGDIERDANSLTVAYNDSVMLLKKSH